MAEGKRMAMLSLDMQKNMKKLITGFIVTGLFVLMAGVDDLEAYNRRHWERLIQTKCCQRCALVKAPLSRIDLTDADLRESDLRGADFKQATLYKVLLPDPEMYHGADFSGAMWVDGRICKKGSISYCKGD